MTTIPVIPECPGAEPAARTDAAKQIGALTADLMTWARNLDAAIQGLANLGVTVLVSNRPHGIAPIGSYAGPLLVETVHNVPSEGRS